VSSAPTVLNATSRTEIGKAAAHLRRTGKVPAVVFGHGLESIAISLDAHEFDHLRRTSRSNAIISLTIDGQGKRNVMLRGFQIDPRTRHLLHVDLFALKSGEEVTVDVPLRTIGESYAVDRLGGTLLHTVSHIRVRALPEKLAPPKAAEETVVGAAEAAATAAAAAAAAEAAVPAGAEKSES
jgi:large subunit ribosomal protein L25